MSKRTEYIARYAKEKYDRVSVTLPKGALAPFKAAIKAQGFPSVNAAINSYVASVASAPPAAKAPGRKPGGAAAAPAQAMGGKAATVTPRQAMELLGLSNLSSVRSAVGRGALVRAAYKSGREGSPLLLSSVIGMAREKGIDLSEKLLEMGLGEQAFEPR